MTTNAVLTTEQINSLPLLTAERFADLVGLPIGVVQAQLDRRILPTVRLGKRRFVNMVALRQMAEIAAPTHKGGI